jgi:hypothetical protein
MRRDKKDYRLQPEQSFFHNDSRIAVLTRSWPAKGGVRISERHCIQYDVRNAHSGIVYDITAGVKPTGVSSAMRSHRGGFGVSRRSRSCRDEWGAGDGQLPPPSSITRSLFRQSLALVAVTLDAPTPCHSGFRPLLSGMGSGFHLAVDTLAVRLTLPPVGCVKDFEELSPAPSSRCALPGAPKAKTPARKISGTGAYSPVVG